MYSVQHFEPVRYRCDTLSNISPKHSSSVPEFSMFCSKHLDSSTVALQRAHKKMESYYKSKNTGQNQAKKRLKGAQKLFSRTHFHSIGVAAQAVRSG